MASSTPRPTTSRRRRRPPDIGPCRTRASRRLFQRRCPRRRRLPGRAAPRPRRPVSYTHLTLPTICSV
eukprot:4804817-Alexandrium_andersonii.AAC.1